MFVDDIPIWGETQDQLNANVDQVLWQLREIGYILNITKCVFSATSVESLGLKLDQSWIFILDDNRDSVGSMPFPEGKHALRSVLDLFSH